MRVILESQTIEIALSGCELVECLECGEEVRHRVEGQWRIEEFALLTDLEKCRTFQYTLSLTEQRPVCLRLLECIPLLKNAISQGLVFGGRWLNGVVQFFHSVIFPYQIQRYMKVDINDFNAYNYVLSSWLPLFPLFATSSSTLKYLHELNWRMISCSALNCRKNAIHQNLDC